MTGDAPHVIWFENLGRGDVGGVGGKNASLEEMVGHLGAEGVSVPPGFATTAEQRSTRPSSLAAIWMATLTDSSWASSRPHQKVSFAPWKTATEAR